jgi:uncharacterized protein YdhG (YjbR/CyaY superfamily)
MKKRPVDNYKNVDEYISYQEPTLQPVLKKIRATIRAIVPNAEECISYMILCYKLNGMLVGFGTHNKRCSFYTMNPAILSFYTEELNGFKYTGSTVHLDPKKNLPAALIKKITMHRIKENEERAWLKSRSKIATPKKIKK